MALPITALFDRIGALDNCNDMKRGKILLGSLIFDLGLFITALTLGSLAARGKLFPVEKSTTIGFFLGGGALLMIDLGILKYGRWRTGAPEVHQDPQDQYRWQYIENAGEPYWWNPAQAITVWPEPDGRNTPSRIDNEGQLPEGWWYIDNQHDPFYINVIDGITAQNRPTD